MRASPYRAPGPLPRAARRWDVGRILRLAFKAAIVGALAALAIHSGATFRDPGVSTPREIPVVFLAE